MPHDGLVFLLTTEITSGGALLEIIQMKNCGNCFTEVDLGYGIQLLICRYKEVNKSVMRKKENNAVLWTMINWFGIYRQTDGIPLKGKLLDISQELNN